MDRDAYFLAYRERVDAEYRAAGPSWDLQVPGLREIWAEHEKKWPLSERPQHPSQEDGSDAWRGHGDRYLTSEVNAQVESGCERIREVGENVITPAMRHIEAEDLERYLVGLEYRLKSPERIKEKVAEAVKEQPELSPEQALGEVPDAIRFTFCYGEDGYAAGVSADLDKLREHGFDLAKPLKNSWESDQYRGINTQWREPSTGQLFEVQFHTEASFEAKQLTHIAYERIRDPETSDLELDELEHFQRQVCAKIPIPPGAITIGDDPWKEHDG